VIVILRQGAPDVVISRLEDLWPRFVPRFGDVRVCEETPEPDELRRYWSTGRGPLALLPASFIPAPNFEQEILAAFIEGRAEIVWPYPLRLTIFRPELSDFGLWVMRHWPEEPPPSDKIYRPRFKEAPSWGTTTLSFGRVYPRYWQPVAPSVSQRRRDLFWQALFAWVRYIGALERQKAQN